MKRILITGKNSYIGSKVESWLNRDREEYIVEKISVRDDKWKSIDFSNYDVVYHVAGIAHVHINKSLEELFFKVNRDLTLDIAKKAKESGVKQFIYMSSMIVYHESNTLDCQILTCETIPEPDGFYGESKLQAEKGLLEMADDQFAVSILRPPLVYGPDIKDGNFPKLLKFAEISPVFPDYHNQRSMLYIDNLCEFVKKIIDLRMAGIFFPQDQDYVDICTLVTKYAARINHKITTTKIFNPFIRISSHMTRIVNKVFGSYCYDKSMSVYGFEYQIVKLDEAIDSLCKK